MSLVTVYDFVDYVRARAETTPGERIDHSGGWHNCAVGQFVEAKHITISEDPEAQSRFELQTVCTDGTEKFILPYDFVCMFPDVFGEDGEEATFYELLNSAWEFSSGDGYNRSEDVDGEHFEALKEINPAYNVDTWAGLAAILDDCTDTTEE